MPPGADRDDVLDRLAEGRPDLVRRQGGQTVELAPDQIRGVERAQVVLSDVGVDRLLEADHRVGHGQQRGGDVDQARAAQEQVGEQPGEVSGQPAAEGHKDRPAGSPAGERLVGQVVNRAQGLGALAGRDSQHRDRGKRLEQAADRGGHGDRYAAVGDEQEPVRAQRGEQAAEFFPCRVPGTDIDGVAGVTEADLAIECHRRRFRRITGSHGCGYRRSDTARRPERAANHSHPAMWASAARPVPQ